MIDKNLLKQLDAAAYSHPDIMPPEILRNDRSPYRVYFRFMCALYMLHNQGVLDVETLKNIKSAFLQDLEIYTLMFNAAAQSAREFQRLDAAVIACNKNADNCEFCRGIYNAKMPPQENEPDIIIGKEGDPK
jgi:hypothetical protein